MASFPKAERRPFFSSGFLIVCAPKHHGFCGQSPFVIAHSGIMSSCCVDIGMSEYIGNQINIARFMVQIGAESAAELVWTELALEGCGQKRIFFDHFFHGAHSHAFALKG